MSGTLYNMPAIQCSDRPGIFPSKTNTCTGLNPNTIYNNLYPCDSKPTLGYVITEDKSVQPVLRPSATKHNVTSDVCASTCTSDSACTAFTINSDKPTCDLYDNNTLIQNSKRYSKDRISKSISSFKFNKPDTTTCVEGCIVDNLQHFSKNPPTTIQNDWDTNIRHTESIKSPTVNTLDACKTECAKWDKCKSLVYTDPDTICKLYNTSTDGKTSAMANTALYKKNSSKCNNILGIADCNSEASKSKYKGFYNKYKPTGEFYNGNIGDNFCKMDGDVCVTDKTVTCKSFKGKVAEVPTYKNPHSKQSVCLPPTCDPNTGNPPIITGIRINDYKFNTCVEGDEFCIDDIYTFDDLGLPVSQDTNNPPDKNFLYTKEYDTNVGFKMLNCPKGMDAYNATGKIEKDKLHFGSYTCKNTKYPTIICAPGEYNKDNANNTCPTDYNKLIPDKKFNKIEDCMNWCSDYKNTPGCKSVVTSFDSNGKLTCNFHSSTPSGVKIKSPGSNIYTRRDDPYIKAPLAKNLKLPAGGCGTFGCCADGITQATDNNGSNCTADPLTTGSKTKDYKHNYLGGTNKRVPVDVNSGSSYVNYIQEPFINYTPNKANNYILKYIIILFAVLVTITIIYSKM
jgi:hypothetical protein